MSTDNNDNKQQVVKRRPHFIDPFDWFERWDPFHFPMPPRLRMWGGLNDELRYDAEWLPPMDVVEEDERIVVKAEVPGVKPEDIDVTVDNGLLVIQGSKEEEKTETAGEVRRSERRWGKFARSLALPSGTEPDELEAEYDKGVLTITIPRTAAKKAHKIEIKSG